MRDALNQLNNDARGLQQALQQSGGTREDLRAVDEIVKTLRQMTPDQMKQNPKGLSELSATALEKLKKLEFDLRKRVDTTNDQLFLSGSDDVPATFQALISEYYRQLSKKTSGGGGGK
jgi:hypothetical protein